jgi:hypothetical protein
LEKRDDAVYVAETKSVKLQETQEELQTTRVIFCDRGAEACQITGRRLEVDKAHEIQVPESDMVEVAARGQGKERSRAGRE